MSDPAFGQLRDHLEGHSRSLIADFDWVRQVGLPLSQVIVWRGPTVDHSPYVGARVGEASHPGPSGGGSRATSRRRAELNMDVDDGVEDSLGLASMLRPLIEKLLKEVLRDLLGSSGLKKLLAGMLAGGQLADASLRPSSAAPPVDDEVSAEGKGNKERWRKRRGGGNAENDGQPKGQGKTGDVAPAKGKGKIGSAELSKGKGKNGGAELSQGNSQSGSGLHPKGKGKTDEPAADDGGGDWTVVGRRAPKASPPAWRLRDADWSDPVVGYDDLVARAGGSDATVRAVALVDVEQKETLTSLYRGSGKAHALLLAVLQTGPGTERCPGSAGGALAFRQVSFTRACTPGLEAPAPKTQVKAGKVEVVPSAVVYTRFLQKFLDKDVWAMALKHPQRLVLEHLARHHLKVMDSWGWSVEPSPGGTGQQQVFGKIRIPEKDVSTLMATSGRQAFFEPARSVPLGPVSTEWVPQQEGEASAAYLARCLTLEAPLGLVAGKRQLGKRAPHDPKVPMQRLWLVQMVPNEVTVEQLMGVLGCAFTDVEMVFQRRRGSTKDYTFRGKSTEQGDSLALPLQFGSESLVLWVRHAPPKKGPSQQQEIRTSGSWSLLGPKKAFGSEPRTGVPGAVETSTGGAGDMETGQPAAKQTAQATADASNKRGPASSEPSPKRVATSQRALPEGVTVDHIEKDGNCLFSSLAKGINLLAPDGHQLTSGEVRARIAVHLRKNEETYVKGWDREMPDRTKAADWGSYVTSIEGDKVWGGLTEIRAACRVWDIRCIIFPTSEHLEPFHVHGQAKRRVVGLYFTGHHYDLLRGDAGKLPRSILEIRANPPVVPMRGGGAHGDDAASVWTRSSRAASGSYWTSATSRSKAGAASPAMVSVRSKPAAGSVPAPPSVWTSTPSAASSTVGANGRRVRAHTLPSCSGGRMGDRTPSIAQELPAGDVGIDGAADASPRLPGLAQWYKRGSVGHPALQPDGGFEQKCDYCAKVFRAVSSDALAKKRYNHYQQWHPNKPRNTIRKVCKAVPMKVIPKATAVDWRCPFCRVAVPRGELGKFSLFAWTRTREEHRLRAHPEVDRKEYASRCRARGLRTTVSVMRKRAQSLNRHQAARQSARGVSSSSNVDLARFVPFTWPLLRKNRSGEKRFTLRAAWRCRHCPRCFYQASFRSQAPVLQEDEGHDPASEASAAAPQAGS